MLALALARCTLHCGDTRGCGKAELDVFINLKISSDVSQHHILFLLPFCFPMPSISHFLICIHVELPPTKRRRTLAGSIVSSALNACLIGTAVGLTVYRL